MLVACLMWWQVEGSFGAFFGDDAERITNALCHAIKLNDFPDLSQIYR